MIVEPREILSCRHLVPVSRSAWGSEHLLNDGVHRTFDRGTRDINLCAGVVRVRTGCEYVQGTSCVREPDT